MTTIAFEAFTALSDDAKIRLLPLDGEIETRRLEPLIAVLKEMLEQWREKGVIRAGAAELIEGGKFILFAYDPTSGDVSGCTKDQLSSTLIEFEKQLDIRILSARRLAANINGTITFLTPPEFKTALREGRITQETTVYDHLLERLGDVRAGKFATLIANSWYQRLMP